ncbi:hypothetical protein NFI96_010382 [Prochilodus magdalenae]|nr:hypothetical protein NFI96_010382 [Prochilodus magdalenae]
MHLCKQSDDSVVMVTYCSADLEFLIIKCRPVYLPCEFNCVFAGIVYVPPDANANAAMEVLCAAIGKLQTDQANGAFIVAGDFNHSNLRSGLPKFFQNVSCTTRGHRTLDTVYTNVANAYKATPLPHFGQSDHLSLFLLPKYTPVIRHVTPATRSVKIWVEGADSFLQQEFKLTDWTPNDFRPVALTSIISKCFERLVLSHLKSCLPATLDPHQFAYRGNRSTEDAISTALHTALTHLDCQNSYFRMLFIDFSAAFNTVIPSKHISKLKRLGISTTLCNCISDFLTDRPQSVKLDNLSSSFISLNTGVPQGCVLSPILYSLFTHDCVPIYGSNAIIKYADDTTVIGSETTTRQPIGMRSQAHPPVYISGAAVEQVTSFKFLGTHISSDLTWSLNSSVLVKKAQQCLYFLRSLKKVHLSPRILVNFYRAYSPTSVVSCQLSELNLRSSDHKADSLTSSPGQHWETYK